MPDGSFPPFDPDTRPARPPRGAAAVGKLADLPPVEAGAALFLRLWLSGETGRSRIIADMAHLLGLGHGASAAQALDRLVGLLETHGRRPLMRHADGCGCLGADEACFAQMVALAHDGERDEAMLMAALMMRADMAPLAVALAEEFGVALRRMTLRASLAAPSGTGHRPGPNRRLN